MLLRCITPILKPFHQNIVYASRFPVVCCFYRQFSCWKCGSQNQNTSQCTACRAILDHTKVNYFELFGLKQSFDVDTAKVVAAYHKLQILYHPDKHTSDDEEEKIKSANFSTLVNKAYSTLSSTLERGIYILKLNNVPLELTSSENQLLLANILEMSDEISQAITKEHLEQLTEKISSEMQEISSLVSKAFEKQDYDEARKMIVKMKYYKNLVDQIKDRQMQVGLKS